MAPHYSKHILAAHGLYQSCAGLASFGSFKMSCIMIGHYCDMFVPEKFVRIREQEAQSLLST
jgi:hypothetical protein